MITKTVWLLIFAIFSTLIIVTLRLIDGIIFAISLLHYRPMLTDLYLDFSWNSIILSWYCEDMNPIAMYIGLSIFAVLVLIICFDE